MKLYEIPTLYQQLLDMAEEQDIDFSEALDSLEDAFEEKAENIVKIMRTLEAKEKAYKDEVDRLNAQRKMLNNRVQALKDYLQENMNVMGKKKVESGLFTVAIQKSPPTLKIDDDKYIPDGYWIPQPPKLDRKELLQDMKLGEEIEGVEIVQGEHVRIR